MCSRLRYDNEVDRTVRTVTQSADSTPDSQQTTAVDDVPRDCRENVQGGAGAKLRHGSLTGRQTDRAQLCIPLACAHSHCCRCCCWQVTATGAALLCTAAQFIALVRMRRCTGRTRVTDRQCNSEAGTPRQTTQRHRGPTSNRQ